MYRLCCKVCSCLTVQVYTLATEHGISRAQVLLSWAVNRGTSVVPKTTREARLKENRQIFKLDKRVMNIIDLLAESRGHVRYLDPSRHIGFDIFDESCDQPIAGNEP